MKSFLERFYIQISRAPVRQTSATSVMGTERLTGALLDRLTHRIHILEANGESYRLRESKDRLKRRQSTRKRK